MSISDSQAIKTATVFERNLRREPNQKVLSLQRYNHDCSLKTVSVSTLNLAWNQVRWILQTPGCSIFNSQTEKRSLKVLNQKWQNSIIVICIDQKSAETALTIEVRPCLLKKIEKISLERKLLMEADCFQKQSAPIFFKIPSGHCPSAISPKRTLSPN